MKTNRKGHKVDRLAAEKRANTARLMEEMPKMLDGYRKRRWEKKMKEEEDALKKVQQLTKDIPLILESLRYSMDVEVQGDKVRRRNEWNKWLLSTGVANSDSGSHPSSSAPENVLATSLQEVSLDAIAHANGNVDASEGHPEMAAGQLSEVSTSQSGLANGDNAEEVHSSSL